MRGYLSFKRLNFSSSNYPFFHVVNIGPLTIFKIIKLSVKIPYIGFVIHDKKKGYRYWKGLGRANQQLAPRNLELTDHTSCKTKWDVRKIRTPKQLSIAKDLPVRRTTRLSVLLI